MKSFIAHTDKIRKELLEEINCSTLEDLFRQIPVKFEKFDMGNPLSELETQKKIKSIAKKNGTEYTTFIGGGVYNKFRICVKLIGILV
jgi:glycine cleavage system pyridoxal-binding protein P